MSSIASRARELQTRPHTVLSSVALDRPKLQRQVSILVVSAHPEIRQRLLQALEGLAANLEGLAANVVTCSDCLRAEELLSRQAFEVVFCDEELPDGSYANLIHSNHWEGRIPRIVVTTTAGDWDLYFAALGKGAFDVIRYPGCPTDVEMAVIRALREEEQSDSQSSQ
jgi:DNA-binding NtrC family response regulator